VSASEGLKPPKSFVPACSRPIAIVASRYNQKVTEALLGGALSALESYHAREACEVHWVPGAFEIPLVARELACSGRFSGVVCLGAVIRGETPHFDFVASACALGLQQAALETGVPLGFGVLTTENLHQALERAGGSQGNKGSEVAISVLETASVIERLRSDALAKGRATEVLSQSNGGGQC